MKKIYTNFFWHKRFLIVWFFIVTSFETIHQSNFTLDHSTGKNKFLPVLVSFGRSEIPDSVAFYCNYMFYSRGIDTLTQSDARMMSREESQRVFSKLQYNNPNESQQAMANRIFREMNPVYNFVTLHLRTRIENDNYIIDSLRWQSVPMPITQVDRSRKPKYFRPTDINTLPWKQVFKDLVDSIIASKQLR